MPLTKPTGTRVSHLHTHARTHTQVCAPDRSPSHCKLDIGFARDRARTAAGRGIVITLFTDRDRARADAAYIALAQAGASCDQDHCSILLLIDYAT